jgi:hypothetical protein
MSQQRSQKLLDWLRSEKLKDNRELESNKKKVINEIKGLTKEKMFPKPKKLSLWKKIKVLILGN